MHVNDHKIQDMGFWKIYIFIILCSQSISHEECNFSFSPPKISMIKM